MQVALFIPCFINELYPDVALSTMKILQSLGYSVVYPDNQTCCGQPYLNNGLVDEGEEFAYHFIDTFSRYDYIVAPASSCISTVKFRYSDILQKSLYRLKYRKIQTKVYELFEFLHDVVGVENIPFKNPYPKRVGLHESCHATRELHLATPSELVEPRYSKIEAILSKIKDIEIVRANKDECCGFGGTFSITQEAISVAMGRDRIADHLSNGVDCITGVDMSCLMHMQSLSQKDKQNIEFIHSANILAKAIL